MLTIRFVSSHDYFLHSLKVFNRQVVSNAKASYDLGQMPCERVARFSRQVTGSKSLGLLLDGVGISNGVIYGSNGHRKKTEPRSSKSLSAEEGKGLIYVVISFSIVINVLFMNSYSQILVISCWVLSWALFTRWPTTARRRVSTSHVHPFGQSSTALAFLEQGCLGLTGGLLESATHFFLASTWSLPSMLMFTHVGVCFRYCCFGRVTCDYQQFIDVPNWRNR